MAKLLAGGYEQLDDNTMRVWVEVPPRRNGEPNAIAAMQALAVASRINTDAFDPQEVAAETIALADGVTANGSGLIDEATAKALIRDGVIRLDDDYSATPAEPPRCATGVCDE